MAKDIVLGSTTQVLFTTRAFATGIPTVLAGSPVISAYEDASLTQITAGVTLTVDHDGVVGLNRIQVVATGGNGFEIRKDYHLVITTGTVGGVSVVGEVVGDFTVERGAARVELDAAAHGLTAIKADTAAILLDTDDIGVAGAGLSAIPIVPANLTQWLGVAPSALTAGRVDVNLLAWLGAPPSALSTGSVRALVTGLDANVITAAAIANAAIDAATFVAGAIDGPALNATAVDKIRDGLLPTQNVAFSNLEFLFVSSTDHATPVTGATGISGTRSIDGGAFVAVSGAIAEVGNGIYQFDALAADMNGGVITFRFIATGGTPAAPDDRFVTIVTGGGV